MRPTVYLAPSARYEILLEKRLVEDIEECSCKILIVITRSVITTSKIELPVGETRVYQYLGMDGSNFLKREGGGLNFLSNRDID